MVKVYNYNGYINNVNYILHCNDCKTEMECFKSKQQYKEGIESFYSTCPVCKSRTKYFTNEIIRGRQIHRRYLIKLKAKRIWRLMDNNRKEDISKLLKDMDKEILGVEQLIKQEMAALKDSKDS